ncbi:MAG: hypothetical protein OXI22_00855 [Defluviicoccus sp.]|nr:hypothetical protein [Defluviicoccus sp.]
MAVKTADQLKEAAQALLTDAGPEFDIDPSEVRDLLKDIVDSVPALGLMPAQAVDLAGALLATLPQFAYDSDSNTLTLDLSAYEPVAPRFYFGLSDDDSPGAAEAVVPAPDGTGRLPAFANRRVAIFRLAHDPDIADVRFGDDPSTNRVADFTKRARRGAAVPVVLPSGLRYAVWYGGRLTKANPVTLAVS